MERHALHAAGGVKAPHGPLGAAVVGGFFAPHLAVGPELGHPVVAVAAFVDRAFALQAAFAVEHALQAHELSVAQFLLALEVAGVFFAAAHQPGLAGGFGTVGNIDGFAIQFTTNNGLSA